MRRRSRNSFGGADCLDGKIRKIAVVGRDWEVWVAALALQRALGRNAIEITVLELPSQALVTDVVATVPAIETLHRVLQVDTFGVAQACSGVPMAGQRFSNWSRSAPPFIHAYEMQDSAGTDPSLLHYWIKARQQGLNVAFEDFSLVAAAAKAGRVVSAEALGEECPLPGYQFDARTFAAVWKKLAVAAGVNHRQGRLAGIDQQDGGIAALSWEDGERITADLYVDASGPEAVLASRLTGAEFENWSRWLPCDQVISASAPPLSPLPPFAQVSAFRAGWVGLHPLQDRTAITGAVSRRFADDDTFASLATIANAPIGSDITITGFTPGCRPRPWLGNCVALGRTALELEPLDCVQLHYLHLGLAQLVTFVETSVDPIASGPAYNDAMYGYARNLRNFQIAHYRLNQRFDEPLWDQARDADGPPELDSKIDSFRRSGDVPMQAYESFTRDSWAAIFVGHGLLPSSYDPWVDEMSEDEHKALMQDRLGLIAGHVQRLPSVESFLGPALRAPGRVEA